ncbi:hypothetical protein RvY_02135 [Ramazzottius varieornatus]|uniref:Uncharacterized protein n=1 Tax=Ramazzottius varieornatus TaxID=947166 RepID=A0A1D1UPM1_RAMVA|nr:hypothetical protein RvY_02135 [Ramazzottius varieornatus]
MEDPWGECESEASDVSFAKFQNSDVFGTQFSFENNFNSRRDFKKLPDSDEYVSALERKLARVQGKKRPASSAASSGPSSRDFVRSLTALRNDRMRELLGTESAPSVASVSNPEFLPSTENIDIDPDNDPLYSSWLMQRLFPDRQALSEEELASLLRFDVLARLNDQFCPTPGSENVSNQADEQPTYDTTSQKLPPEDSR